MNVCLTTQHENYISYWVSDSGFICMKGCFNSDDDDDDKSIYLLLDKSVILLQTHLILI